jgi:ketosteroid isomerase-like protein
MESALEIVNRFYEVTNNRKGEGLADLVAEDITFEGPLMRTSGAREYLALNAQLLPFHRGTRMLRQFETGEEVCSIYEMTLATPEGGSLSVKMADLIRVKDGRVAEQKIYYDPREFAKAFGM